MDERHAQEIPSRSDELRAGISRYAEETAMRGTPQLQEKALRAEERAQRNARHDEDSAKLYAVHAEVCPRWEIKRSVGFALLIFAICACVAPRLLNQRFHALAERGNDRDLQDEPDDRKKSIWPEQLQDRDAQTRFAEESPSGIGTS